MAAWSRQPIVSFVVRYASTWRHDNRRHRHLGPKRRAQAARKNRSRRFRGGQIQDEPRGRHAHGRLVRAVQLVRRTGRPNEHCAHDDRDILAGPASPVRLGSLAIGAGESVRATRFADGRLYVVTFFSIDPAWSSIWAIRASPLCSANSRCPAFPITSSRSVIGSSRSATSARRRRSRCSTSPTRAAGAAQPDSARQRIQLQRGKLGRKSLQRDRGSEPHRRAVFRLRSRQRLGQPSPIDRPHDERAQASRRRQPGSCRPRHRATIVWSPFRRAIW